MAFGRSMGGLMEVLILLMFLIYESHQYTYTCNITAPCGCSSASAIVNRIVGGEAAGARSWGWAVSLSIGGGLCGGSILANQWILTAAHCVPGVSPSSITVYAGSNTLFSGQSRSVSAIYSHPRYDTTTFANDIAILRLSTPLNMSDPNVERICIPNVNSTVLSTTEWPSPDLYLSTVGWGTLSEGGSVSVSLQQVSVPIVSNTHPNCSRLITTANRPLQFCAGYLAGTKDTCQGDSGGSIMMYTTSRQWVQVGIVSFGEGCGRPGRPGVYTRLAYYRDWIANTTGGAILNPGSVNSANINPIASTTVVTVTTRQPSTTTPSTTGMPWTSSMSTTGSGWTFPTFTIPIFNSCETIFRLNQVSIMIIMMIGAILIRV